MLLEGINPVISFQKKLYLDFLKRIYKLTGKKKGTLTHYEMEFQNSLPRDYEVAHPDKLLGSFAESDIVLFGDFHTLVNSQEILLRTLKLYVEKNGTEGLGIALEAFLAKDKKDLSLFLSAEISEEELLKRTQYYKKWCFPWAHYRKILLFAKENKIPVFPVNSSLKSVYMRDEDISRNLSRGLVSLGEKGKIFCLIGEFHLAEKHLHLKLIHRNRSFRKRIRLMRVLSNVDEYFFSKKEKRNRIFPDCLFLSQNYYCLVDTPPWIKWFTYAQWEDDLEQETLHIRSQEGLEVNDYLRFSSSYDDVEFFLGELVKKVASFFHVTVNINDFYRYYLDEISQKSPRSSKVFTLEAFFSEQFLSFRSHFLDFSEERIVFSKLTLGSLISSVGSILFSLKLKKKKVTTPEELFSREILAFILSFLCEFLLNPHSQKKVVKSDILLDLNEEGSSFWGFLRSLKPSHSDAEILEEMKKRESRYFTSFSYSVADSLFHKVISEGDSFLLDLQKTLFVGLKRRPLKLVLKELLELI